MTNPDPDALATADEHPASGLGTKSRARSRRALKISALVLPLFLLAVFALPAGAQPAGGPPPEAKEFMSRGQEHAKNGKWKDAFNAFSVANSYAPYAPAPLFNMGLAYDRMGNQELAAIRLYNAFLAAAPGAKNASQVRKRIKELQAAVRDKAKRLLAIVENAVRQHPDKSFDRSSGESNLAEAYAAIGNVSEARVIALRMGEDWVNNTLIRISIRQAMWGDFNGAGETTKLLIPGDGFGLGPEEQTVMSYEEIAKYMAWGGDVANALKGAIELKALAKKAKEFNYDILYQYRAKAYMGIADRLIWVGKIAEAKSVMEKAVQDVESIKEKDPLDRASLYSDITRRWVSIGALREAKESAAAAAAAKQYIQYGTSAYNSLAIGLAAAGDIEGARWALGKMDYEDKGLKKEIDVIAAAKQAVQDAPAGPQRKAANENLERYSKYPISNYLLPPAPDKTLTQLEIETWNPHRKVHASTNTISAFYVGLLERVSSLKNNPPSLIIDKGSALIINMMEELAHHRRIAIDFQKRRKKAATD